MKRTAKILAILLTLVLAFGIAAIVTSAESVTGVTQKISGNFDGLATDYKTDAKTGNPSGTGYTWQLKDRVGTMSVGVSEDESGNKYMIFTQSPWVKNSGPYLGTGYGGANLTAGKRPSVDATTKALSLNGTDVAGFPYLVFDFDIMAPGNTWAGNITLELRSFMNDGNTGLDSIYYSNASQNMFVFKSDENGPYIGHKSGNEKFYVAPGEFNHVTLIWKAIVTETTRSVDLYAYVNGEFFFYYEGGAPHKSDGTKFTKGYYDDTPHLSYDEIRINWPADKADASNVSAFDNIVTRIIDTKYTGNIETVLAAKDDIFDWDANIYDAENMPFGLAVAKVGDVKYDSLAKAIAATPEKGTVTLLRSVTTPVVVDKMLTVEAGNFTAKLVGGEGYAVDDTTPGTYKVVSSAGQTVEVIWDECYCDPFCEDYSIKHPVNHCEEEVAIYTKFYDIYNPSYTGYIGDDGIIYTLAGWINTATGEMIDENTSVTEDDIFVGFVELEPVWEKAVIDFYWTEGGVDKFCGVGEKTLDQVIKAADAGSTIKLGNDIVTTSTIDIGKKLTIDVNGHSIKAMAASKTKWSMFRATEGTDVTFTSSVPGGQLFNGGFNNETTTGCSGLVSLPNDVSTIRFNGKDAEGNTTLTVAASVLIEGYSNTCNVYIDGGMYIAPGSDNNGFIDLRKAGGELVIKNATFYSLHSSGILSFGGRNHHTDGPATVTVDNCVLITAEGNPAIKFVVDPVVMTITNTYIYGSITAGINSTYTKHVDDCACANKAGSIILGEGVYIEGAINGNVTCVDGYDIFDASPAVEEEFTYVPHKWVINNTFTYLPESFVLTPKTETLAFSKKVASNETVVTVIWKDAEGNVIGTNEALPGNNAVPPVDMKTAGTIIPGWLDYIPAEWNEDLLVPEGIEEYVITAKEGGSVTPFAKAQIFYNFAMETHLQARIFLPVAAEGIEVVGVSLGGTDRLSVYNSSAKYMINGVAYKMVSIWPGMINALSNRDAVLKFTYEGETYTVTGQTDFVKYANYVLANDYSEDAKDLVASVATYIYYGATVLGNTAAAEKIADLVADNTSRIADIESANANDVSALADYVGKITLKIEAYNPTFTFALTDKAIGTKVNGTAITASGASVSMGKTRFSATNAYTITVTPAEGEAINATYSLVNYYNALKEAGADANTLAFVRAMYSVALADAAY